ncbi:MAG TPA: HlyD family efflux transporter periplasmic adaptor subunit, partial [Thermoguttaceae bacterium]|nr:HlyD family efflux transporter periplasmic adaptor subunit [Thermoguttaceae bacterium]
GKVALKQAEESLRVLEATTPLDLTAAERAGRIAEEDLARHLEVDRPMNEKSARFMLEGAQNSLEYEMEELRQLEKMYNADDLTEETEEIILKRQRNAVKRAEFSLELAKIRCEQALEIGLPRDDEAIEDSTLRAKLARAKARVTLPLALRAENMELEKLKVEQARGNEKLQKLLADREAMIVTAPADGIVYYGRCVRGKWSGAASVAEKLRPGGSILANDVFMTIVKPGPMFVRAAVPEKELHWIRPELKGTGRPTAFPDMRLAAAVAEVDPIPSSAGSFEARIRVSLKKQAEAIMPGMECSVKLVPYLNKKALTVPATALGTDPLDDQKHYVVRVGKDEKQKKQRVVIGKKAGDRVEILKGLSEGDEVLLEYPKDKQ